MSSHQARPRPPVPTWIILYAMVLLHTGQVPNRRQFRRLARTLDNGLCTPSQPLQPQLNSAAKPDENHRHPHALAVARPRTGAPMVQRHLPRAQGRLLDLHHRDRRGPAGDRRALRLRGAAGNRRPHRRAQARPHRPRPPRRGPDPAQRGGARQRHRQRRPRLRPVGLARKDRRQTDRRPALLAGANPPAPPPPLRFLGGALRLGRPSRVRRRRGSPLRRRGLHRLQDAPGHSLGLVRRHRRPLPEDSAPG